MSKPKFPHILHELPPDLHVSQEEACSSVVPAQEDGYVTFPPAAVTFLSTSDHPILLTIQCPKSPIFREVGLRLLSYLLSWLPRE